MRWEIQQEIPLGIIPFRSVSIIFFIIFSNKPEKSLNSKVMLFHDSFSFFIFPIFIISIKLLK